MARPRPCDQFDAVYDKLQQSLGALPTLHLFDSRRTKLQELAVEIRHYLQSGKVSTAYEDLALVTRPDCQQKGWGGLAMGNYVREKLQKQATVMPHPATTISTRMLRPLLMSVASRLYKYEFTGQKAASVPAKGSSRFAKLVAANRRQDFRKLIDTIRGYKKNKKYKKTPAAAYLLAKGMPLLDDLGKERRPYLLAAQRINNFVKQAMKFADLADIVAMEFIADTLVAIAPAELVSILDRCVCCHRHASIPVWQKGERRGINGAKIRDRLCFKHQTTRKGDTRDFSGYSRAYRTKQDFVRAVDDADHVFYTLARADSDFLEAAYFVDHFDGEGNPLQYFLETFASKAPLRPEVRQCLLDCVGKVRNNDWTRFLLNWYEAVDDAAAAKQVQIILDHRAHDLENYQLPSIEAGDMIDASDDDHAEFGPLPGPLSAYRPEAFIEDLIRYQAYCEITAEEPRYGRPEVILDETRILKLAKAGKTTQAISKATKVSAEKIRLFLKAHAVAEKLEVPLDTVKAVQRDCLRQKQKGLKGYIPLGKSFKVTDKLARSIAEALFTRPSK